MTPILFSQVVLSLAVGAFRAELVTDSHTKLLENFSEETNRFLSKNGYNGLKQALVANEVMSKVISGKIYVIKAFLDNIQWASENDFTEDMSLCFRIYDHFGSLSLININFCNSIVDDLEDEKLISF